MKKSNRSSLLMSFCALCFIASLTSCMSAKQLTYLRDVTPNQTIKGAPKPPPVYKIRVGDNLFVSITSQDPDMNKIIDPANGNQNNLSYEGASVRALNGNIVHADGTIQLQMLGKVPVEGKTISEAEDQVRLAAKDYLKEVAVKVRVLTYKITVVGEVKMPGVFYNYNNYITIFDAIGLAQGTTDFAKLADVLVVRNTPTGSRTYSLNLNSKTSLASDAYYLQPGDVVLIQPAKNKGLQQKLPFAGVLVGSASAILLLLNYLHK
ncbi:MAG TPA: polysaccharide biosynthesis/export family protein [Puia sp.]|nr:polysaccharide biosynthesis/export family protein [Puia sp.]